MGVGTGMRGKDLQKFLLVADQFNVTILVRHTNRHSLPYIEKPGYYPKPAVCKAKTADQNPPQREIAYQGRKINKKYEVAGLVVHPDFHGESCYEGAKLAKAQDAWNHTLEVLSPVSLRLKVDPNNPNSWPTWGAERQGVGASARWSWRVDVDPNSAHFGCLQLKNPDIGWSYVHGDYDLKDVIVEGREEENLRRQGVLDGVRNNIPDLHGVNYKTIQVKLNCMMGADMVQHGSEAQFAWHGDEPITVASPGWKHLVLYDAATVQSWYMNLKRDILAKKGLDYRTDPKRIFNLGAADGRAYRPGEKP
jgi:hypothetical protein